MTDLAEAAPAEAPRLLALTGDGPPLVLEDDGNLIGDGAGWRIGGASGARLRVERRRDGWWLIADPDVELGGFPVVRPMPLGGVASIRCLGAPALTLAADPGPRPVWDVWVESDLGPRFHQEDAASAGGWFISVADGVASRPAGDVASAGVVRAVTAAALAAGGPRVIPTVAQVAEAAMAHLGATGAGARGMTTTLTAAVAAAPDPKGVMVRVAHIGDSALLWFRRASGELKMVTELHHIPDRPNTLLRAISDDSTPVMELHRVLAQPGDVLVACTDGLTGAVGLAELGALIGAHRGEGAAALAEELIGAAIEGTDNVSVAVGIIPGPGQVPPSQPTVLFLPLEATTAEV